MARFIPDPTGAMGPGGMARTIAVPSATERIQSLTSRLIARPAVGGGVDPAAMSALQKARAYWQPGGGYGAGVEAGIERGRTKAVASGMQRLVSAGLAGTTMAAGLGKKYEEEVAMPTRARVEETRAQAISGLETMKAQIIQGATEAARSRALQQYLAKLQMSASLQRTTTRRPSLVSAGAPTVAPTRPEPKPVYEFPRVPSLISGRKYGYPETEGKFAEVGPALKPATPDMYREEFDTGQWFEPGGWLSEQPQRGPGGYNI